MLLRFDALHAQLLIDDQPVFDAALPTPPALSRVGIGVKGGRVTLRRWHVTPEP